MRDIGIHHEDAKDTKGSEKGAACCAATNPNSFLCSLRSLRLNTPIFVSFVVKESDRLSLDGRIEFC
jgi:hypothetical protein